MSLQCHVRDLDVLRLHRERELQSALAPRIFRVVRSYLAQVKALDELYKLSSTNYAMGPKPKTRKCALPKRTVPWGGGCFRIWVGDGAMADGSVPKHSIWMGG